MTKPEHILSQGEVKRTGWVILNLHSCYFYSFVCWSSKMMLWFLTSDICANRPNIINEHFFLSGMGTEETPAHLDMLE